MNKEKNRCDIYDELYSSTLLHPHLIKEQFKSSRYLAGHGLPDHSLAPRHRGGRQHSSVLLGAEAWTNASDVLRPRLIGGVHHDVGDLNVRGACGRVDDVVRDVTRHQWLEVLVDGVRLVLRAQPDGGELSVHQARRDDAHADGRAHQVVARGGGERVDSELGGAVHAAAGVRLVPRDRADVDHVPLGARAHAGEEGAREADDRRHVGREHLLRLRHVVLPRGGDAEREPRVVDQNAHWLKALGEVVGQGGELGEVLHIEGDEARRSEGGELALERRGELVQPLRAPADEHQLRPQLGEPPGARLADA
mmetsp:Transcript_9028/g.21729  ORF Transcript_9028/g.21729 Transcript_9028/m.21729 type:complete len:308 (+) Transcript_9028:56-979(+)